MERMNSVSGMMSALSDPALNATLPVRARAQRQAALPRKAGGGTDLQPCSLLRDWGRKVARGPVCSGALGAYWQHPVRPDVSNMPGPT